MSKHCVSRHNNRDVVLIVGSTGSLGKPIAAELRRRHVVCRLLGRSNESFAKAGFTSKDEAGGKRDLKVYAQEQQHFPDEWFVDVKAVICVARPRWSKPDDRTAFEGMIRKLTAASIQNDVPDTLLLGRPYVSSYAFGMTPNMRAYEEAEKYAEACFDRCRTGVGGSASRLTIARIGEISEIGHLLEIAQRTHVWMCVRGYNPRLQPIDAPTFATAAADFVQQGEEKRPDAATGKTNVSEFLVGSKEIIAWRDLGRMISEELAPEKLHFVDVPLWSIALLLKVFHLCGKLFPIFHGFENILRITSIPMTAESTSPRHISVGDISVREYIRSRIRSGKQASDVRGHIDAVQRKSRSKQGGPLNVSLVQALLSSLLVIIVLRSLIRFGKYCLTTAVND